MKKVKISQETAETTLYFLNMLRDSNIKLPLPKVIALNHCILALRDELPEKAVISIVPTKIKTSMKA